SKVAAVCSGRIVSSRHCRNFGRSSCGSPINARKIVDGNGGANSSWNSHSPRGANTSMISFTSLRSSGSSSAIRFGEDCRASSRRYLAWSGGSTDNGRSGTSLPTFTTFFDEKTSGCFSAHSTSSYFVTYTLEPNGPSLRWIGQRAWTSWYTSCGVFAHFCENMCIPGSTASPPSVAGAASLYISAPRFGHGQVAGLYLSAV